MRKGTLRIGFLSANNPHDRRSFSGTPYYMLRALQDRPELEVRVLGPHHPRRPGLLGKLSARLLRRPELRRQDIDDRGLDAIISLTSSRLVAEFGAALAPPIILVTDATPAFLREFYGRNIPPEGDRIEACALSTAAHVAYSSDYMASRAQVEFPTLAPERVHVIPFGVNLDHLPANLPEKPPLSSLRLLFIGKKWLHKGGDKALAALEILQSAGIDVQLTVIGCTSPEAEAHPAVEVLGYLDKNDSRDAARLTDALTRAHVFILPTRADCTPMVVAEANAHGCPVLITQTGGIPTLMDPGRNGWMLPPDADGVAYAAAIRDMTTDPEVYRKLSASSFAHCRERLTWEGWARDMVDLLKRTVVRGSEGVG